MFKILVLSAHPDLSSSRLNAAARDAILDVEGVTFHDLSAAYPDFQIDVAREQELLLGHDVIVWQFPFYWYSVPPVLKKWMDDVLLYGFAYGSEGTKLHGKKLLLAFTTGGPAESYTEGGYNHYTLEQLTLPQRATANLCGMEMLEPVVLSGAFTVSDESLAEHVAGYRARLEQLASA